MVVSKPFVKCKETRKQNGRPSERVVRETIHDSQKSTLILQRRFTTKKQKKRNKKETIDKWDTPTYFWEPLTKWCREKGNGLDKRF